MTAQLDLERVLDDFLGDGSSELSDHVLDAALNDIARTRQRRVLSVPRRFSDMPTPVRLLAAAAILAAAMGGAFLLGGTLRNDQSPSQVRTTEPSPNPTSSSAMLPAGSHTTTIFEPTVTFTVPRGWVLNQESQDFFELCPASLDNCSGGQVQVYRFPAGEKPVPVDNSNNVVPGVGTGLLEAMTYVGERSDLEVIQPPTPWEVDGLSGYWMEVANPGQAELILFKSGQNLYPTGHNRFAYIQLPDGTVVSIVIFTFEGTEAFIDLATPIIESLDFTSP
jgi:hypothetical protein